jgi:5-methylcytosine-specific restriction endonuclease McrA
MRYILSSKKKEELRNQLYERDGRKCHYCGIEEDDFRKIWGELFYGAKKRGQTLEIDRKDNNQGYNMANCVLACALCNMAKSNKFHYAEFKRVGNVVREIWQERKSGVSKKHCYG